MATPVIDTLLPALRPCAVVVVNVAIVPASVAPVGEAAITSERWSLQVTGVSAVPSACETWG